MEPYRTTMKAIIKKIGYDYDIEIVELEIPEDHIHMVIRSIPKQSPSDVMQIVKSITAREFFRIYPEIKKKYFWGAKLWTQSYFVETIGNANKKQLENMFKISFESPRVCQRLNNLRNWNYEKIKSLYIRIS